MRGTYLANEGEKAAWDEEEELLLEDESDDEAAPSSWFGRNVGNLLNNVAGSQTLTKGGNRTGHGGPEEDFTGEKCRGRGRRRFVTKSVA